MLCMVSLSLVLPISGLLSVVPVRTAPRFCFLLPVPRTTQPARNMMSKWPSRTMATISSLIEDFLRNPVIEIRLADSAEIVQLRLQLEAVQREVVRARTLYGQEVNRSLRFEDFLRSIGVNPGTLK